MRFFALRANAALAVPVLAAMLALGSVARLRAYARQESEPVSSLRSTTDHVPNQRATLLFLFRPGDCPFALDVIDDWNALSKTQAIEVQGLMLVDTLSLRDWKAVIRDNRITFPVRVVGQSDIDRHLRHLGARHLPLSVLLSRSGMVQLVLSGLPSDGSRVSSLVRQALDTSQP